jgi:hypothetical protein
MDNRNYKVAVIYHSQDLDGITSGALAKIVSNILRSEMRLDVDLIGYNYGNDSVIDKWLDTDQVKYDRYQFIDITPPNQWLESVANIVYDADNAWLPKIDIFDHHQDKFDQISENEKISRMMITYVGVFPPMNYFFLPDKSGALIYYDSLKDLDYWINDLIDSVDKTQYIDKAGLLKKLFPKRYIVRQIEKLLGEWVYSEQLHDFIKLVSKYDTWQWYPKWLEEALKGEGHSSAWEPLALNEWLYSQGYENINMEWLFEKLFGRERADWVKKSNGITLGVNNYKFISIGLDQIEKKRKAAKAKNYTFTKLLGREAIMVFDYISFYESQAMNDVRISSVEIDEKDWKRSVRAAEVLISYRFDFTKQIIKLSFRSLIGSDVDCCSLAKTVGIDNGGGHYAAAGCRVSFERFNELFMKNNKS